MDFTYYILGRKYMKENSNIFIYLSHLRQPKGRGLSDDHLSTEYIHGVDTKNDCEL